MLQMENEKSIMKMNTAIYDSLRVIVMGMILVDVIVMVMVEVLVIREYKWENIERGKSTENQGGKKTGFPRE